MSAWDLHRLPMTDPGDVTSLDAAILGGDINPAEIIGVISQPEGTGYARALTMLQLSLLVGKHLDQSPDDVVDRVPMMMIGLCGGLMSPHHNIITRTDGQGETPTGDPRLAVGVASTRDVEPAELGSAAQAKMVAEAVGAAISDGGMTAEDITCVQIKCPAMTPERAKGLSSIPGGSLGAASSFSKAAAALGIAIALGEVDAEAVTDDVVNRDRSLFTSRGSVSAGGEHTACRVLAFGNSTSSTSTLRSGCGVMTDQLDVKGIMDALGAAGIDQPSNPLAASDASRVRQVFINCGADLTGEVRGRRHTINSDFMAGQAGIMAKAVANAVVASVVGDPMVLASAGAEHQGPLGSNLITVLSEVAT
jgi:cyanuric acid amidohydrolase